MKDLYQSGKNVIMSISKLPYVIQRNWYNLSFSMYLSEKGQTFYCQILSRRVEYKYKRAVVTYSIELFKSLVEFYSDTFIKNPIMLIGVINQIQGQNQCWYKISNEEEIMNSEQDLKVEQKCKIRHKQRVTIETLGFIYC